MKKAVVTVLGQDKVGITAKICGVLAETNINILDISQTIVGGLGMKIKIQHTEIFDAMHRI